MPRPRPSFVGCLHLSEPPSRWVESMRASGPATAGAEPSPQGEGNPLAGLKRPRRGSSWAKRARPPRRGARRGSSQGYAVDLPPRARERTLRRPGYPLFSFSKFSPRPSPPKGALAKTKAEREKRLARSNSPRSRQPLPVEALRHERLERAPLDALDAALLSTTTAQTPRRLTSLPARSPVSSNIEFTECICPCQEPCRFQSSF